MPTFVRHLLPTITAAFMAVASHANARPAISVDVDTGRVIAAHDEFRSWHPASVTKLMTAAVMLDAVRTGRFSLDTPIHFSANATSTPPSRLGVKAGTAIPLGDALRIMLTRSMNDVAVAIAETAAGSEQAFAAVMNLKAAALGMHGTRFANASGLHDPQQVSTAADLAILARHIVLDFPESAGLFGIPSVQYGGKTLRNTNGLVGNYRGARGMKTGYVCASGFNLVGLAERQGRRIVTVVLGAPSARQRERESGSLLDMAFATGSGGGPLASGPSGPVAAIDLREFGCGKSLGERFSFETRKGATPRQPSRQHLGDIGFPRGL